MIILDIMLPKVNGFEVCSRIREKNINTPIIMLSAKDQDSDVVTGLNLGADDYVTKPFSITQLLARVEALLRRTAQPEPDIYQFGDFKLDNVNQKLTHNGVEVPLSPKEFKVLQILVKKRGSVLTRDEILNRRLWRFAFHHRKEYRCLHQVHPRKNRAGLEQTGFYSYHRRYRV